MLPFSLLLESGMDLAGALEAVSVILGNTYAKERFLEAVEDTMQGVSLTASLQKLDIFPQMLIQMLAVGEQTASLEEVLGRSCAFFDDQVESSLTSIASKIQPIMLIVMGIVIATLFVAVYSPMLSIMGGLS